MAWIRHLWPYRCDKVCWGAFHWCTAGLGPIKTAWCRSLGVPRCRLWLFSYKKLFFHCVIKRNISLPTEHTNKLFKIIFRHIIRYKPLIIIYWKVWSCQNGEAFHWCNSVHGKTIREVWMCLSAPPKKDFVPVQGNTIQWTVKKDWLCSFFHVHVINFVFWEMNKSRTTFGEWSRLT